jgi:hypothetical protein
MVLKIFSIYLMFLFHAGIIFLLYLVLLAPATQQLPPINFFGIYRLSIESEGWAIVRTGAYLTFLMGLECIDVQLETIVRNLFMLGAIVAYFI